MISAVLILLLLNGVGEADGWKPPQNPVPRAILQEAKKDADEGRYETALAKHTWYHDHAAEHDASAKYDRLSTALRRWHELGKKFPLAMEKLKDYRDRAMQRVQRGEHANEDFREYAEINRILGQHARTVRSFRSLHEQDPKTAKALFWPASAALMHSREYELYGKYIDARQMRVNLANLYENQHRMAELYPEHKEQRLRVADDVLWHEGSMLVACLVIAGREEEAKKSEQFLRTLSDSAEFHRLLDRALNGDIPPPLGTYLKPR